MTTLTTEEFKSLTLCNIRNDLDRKLKGSFSTLFLYLNISMESPCVKICKFGEYLSQGQELVCIGCGRTQDEIRDWTIYTDEKRREVMERLDGFNEYVITTTN